MQSLLRLLNHGLSRQTSRCRHQYSTTSGNRIRRWKLGLSTAVGGTGVYCSYLVLTDHEELPPDFPGQLTVTVYRRLPLNALSRLWGTVNSWEVPYWLRQPTYRLYSLVYGCRLDEALQQDLSTYRNLSEFFRRPLRLDVRPIDSSACLTSPVDGRVLYLGRVESGHMEQVKGVTYTLRSFLGPSTWSGQPESSRSVQDKDYQEMIRLRPDSSHQLYHCVIYLAPGDYHRFHAPTDWRVQMRRHFPGHLLSVSPCVAARIRGLFAINERAVYLGEWEHGFFSYTAVGATNVGSVVVFSDPQLKTNVGSASLSCQFTDHSLKPNVDCVKGELFGEFNLGSTIVLIFEAPANFEFTVGPNDRVKFGEALGRLLPT